MTDTYLVAGCAGFIGSTVAQFLLADGNAVIGIDDLCDSYDVNLKEWRLAQLRRNEGFEFLPADITDIVGIRAAFKKDVKAVINLAARAGVRYSVENPWVYLQTNSVGTTNLLELCKRFEIPKFVLASTSSLYGDDTPRPFLETAPTDRPMSPYAASKKAAEAMAYAYHHLYGIDVSVMRYFTVYGPAGRPDMSALPFVQWISEGRPLTLYGDGSQSRDYTYVDDIARGTIAALRPLGYEIINLGSDTPVVLSDFIRLVEDTVGKKAQIERKPAHRADVHATWADISKAKQLLGWQPQVTIEEGVRRLVDWYNQNRAWAKDIKTG